MRIISFAICLAVAGVLLAAGILAFPYAFADRITKPMFLAGRPFFGLRYSDVPILLSQVSEQLLAEQITVEFRGQTHTTTREKLGLVVDITATTENIQRQVPLLAWQMDQGQARQEIATLFRNVIRPPKNASLIIAASGNIQLVKSKPGEAVDSLVMNDGTIRLRSLPAAAQVQDTEVAKARALVTQLLENGLKLQFEDQAFAIRAQEMRRLIEFIEQVDPQQPENFILGVRLHPERLREYLEKIAQEINREPVNAKFELSTVKEVLRVTQFATPERGLTLSIDTSAEKIAQAITVGDTTVPLAVTVRQPAITQPADLEKLGITELIASGESDFAGSPRNRIHNITVGAARYHGLLIVPGEEFSFNEHLGPVTAATGFKPELVIKKNVTTPEYGGGLCQVSTTAFRAAVQAGLKITARRAHAYAVRYYGTPGFDATIYPNYTDLRFQNNTPGHILVQTKIEGTRLVFSFYGTPDGRTVEIDGPHPYNRRPDGSVKATLTQRVFQDGQTILDETFQSNYRSPALFPRT